MHQHISILNFKPLRLLTLRIVLTSMVRNSVTIGIGAFIHISKA